MLGEEEHCQQSRRGQHATIYNLIYYQDYYLIVQQYSRSSVIVVVVQYISDSRSINLSYSNLNILRKNCPAIAPSPAPAPVHKIGWSIEYNMRIIHDSIVLVYQYYNNNTKKKKTKMMLFQQYSKFYPTFFETHRNSMII